MKKIAVFTCLIMLFSISCSRYVGEYVFTDIEGTTHTLWLEDDGIALMSISEDKAIQGEWDVVKEYDLIVVKTSPSIDDVMFFFKSVKKEDRPHIKWSCGYIQPISSGDFYIKQGYIYHSEWDARAGETSEGYKLTKR